MKKNNPFLVYYCILICFCLKFWPYWLICFNACFCIHILLSGFIGTWLNIGFYKENVSHFNFFVVIYLELSLMMFIYNISTDESGWEYHCDVTGSPVSHYHWCQWKVWIKNIELICTADGCSGFIFLLCLTDVNVFSLC